MTEWNSDLDEQIYKLLLSKNRHFNGLLSDLGLIKVNGKHEQRLAASLNNHLKRMLKDGLIGKKSNYTDDAGERIPTQNRSKRTIFSYS